MSKVQSTSIEELRKQSIQNLVNNLEASAPKQTGTKQSINPQDFTFNKNAKFNTSNIDNQLGEDNKYVPLNAKALQQQMDDAQSNWSSALNAGVTGAIGAIATTAENLSYLPNTIKQWTTSGAAEWESNAIADAAKDFKEGLYNAMPLYTDDENGMSFWEGVRGVVDSAVGFGISGGVVGTGVKGLSAISGLSKLAKVTRLATRMRALGVNWAPAAKVVQSLGQGAPAIASGLIMNDLEGTMVGMQIYEDLIAKGIDPEEAGKRATHFKNLNRLNAVSDIIQVSGLFGASKATRNLLDGRGVKNQLKSFGKVSTKNPLVSAIGEGWEEINQGMLTNEVTYRALKEKGLSTEDFESDNVLGRAIDYAFTKEAGFEGLLGLVGGGPQALITTAMGSFDKEGNAIYDKRMQEQQETIAAFPELVKKTIQENANMKAVIENAEVHGEEAQKLIADAQFAPILIKAFENGTTGSLESHLESVAELTPAEAEEAGYSENYREVVAEHIQELRNKENLYLANYNNVNRDAILNRTYAKELHEKLVGHKQTKEDKARAALDKRAVDIAKGTKETGEYKSSITTKNGNRKGDVIVTEGTAVYDPYAETPSSNSKFNKAVEATSEYKAFITAKESRERDEETVRNIQTEIDDLNSIKNQTRTEYNIEEGKSIIDKIGEAKSSDDLINLKERIAKDKKLETNTKQALLEVIDSREETIVKEEQEKIEANKSEEELLAKKAKKKEANKKASKLKKEKEVVEKGTKQVEKPNKKQQAEIEAKNEQIASMQEELDRLKAEAEENTLTHTEEKNLAAKQLAKDLEDSKDLTMTDAKNNTVDEAVTDLETESIEHTNRPIITPGRKAPTGLYEKIATSYNVMAFLSRMYNRLVSGDGSVTSIQESTDELVPHSLTGKLFFNQNILDPNKFPTGTKITLEIDNTYKGDIIYEGIPVSWDTFRKGRDGITAKEIEEHTPIVIKANGEKIAYLHQSDWASETNLNTEVHTIEENREMLNTIRKNVIENGKFETTISHKTNGKFFIYADKVARPLTEAMPDPNLRIAVAKSADVSEVTIGDRTVQVINKKLVPGGTYVVVPTHGGKNQFLAIPVGNIKLSEHDDARKSILAAIAAYNGEVSSEQEEFVNKMGWDNSTNAGKDVIKNYISKFIHLVNKGDTLKGVTQEQQNKANRKANQDYINGKDSERSFLMQAGGKLVLVAGSQNIETALKTNDNTEELLGKIYLQPNTNELGDNKNAIETISGEKSYKDFVKETTRTTIKSNKLDNEATGGKDVYVYTIQPVVYFDTDSRELSKKEKVLKDTDISDAEWKSFVDINKVSIQTLTKVANNIINNKTTERDLAIQSANGKKIETILQEVKNKSTEEDLGEESFGTAITLDGTFAEMSENSKKPSKEKTVKSKDLSKEQKIQELKDAIADPDNADFKDVLIQDLKELEDGSNNILTSDALYGSEISENQQDSIKDANKEILVEGFNITEQYAATDSIIDIMVAESIKTTDKLSIKKLSKLTQAKFKNATIRNQNKIKAAEDKYPEGNFIRKRIITRLESNNESMDKILEQYPKLESFAIARMEAIGLVSIKSNGEEVVNILEQTEFNKDDITRDSRDTVSAEVRRLMHGLTKKNNEGEVQTNYFGFPVHEDFEKIKSATQALLHNATNNFNDQLAVLSSSSKQVKNEKVPLYPWLPELVSKLQEADDKLKRQFTIAMNQPYNHMSFIQWEVNADGYYVMRRVNADSASKERTLLSNWSNANMMSDLYTVNSIDYQVNTRFRDELLKDIETLSKENATDNEENLLKFFAKLGIDIEPQVALAMKNGVFTHRNKKRSYSALFTDANGFFKILEKSLKSMDSDMTFDQNNIFNQSIMKSLASYNGYYVNNVHATSYNNEGKSVSSNSNPKYIVDRINFLKSELGADEVDELLKLAFSSNSELLKALQSSGGKGRSALLEAFAYDYAAFNPFKKAKSSSFGDSSLSSMSDADHEAYKLSLFGAHIAKDRTSYTRYLIPTNADKSTSMSMTGVYKRAFYKDGKIDSKTIDRLYEGLFLPEYTRMAANMDTTIAGFEKAKDIFIFLPELNTIEGLFDSNGKIAPMHKVNELRSEIDKVIESYILSLAAEKEAKWEKAGIGVKHPIKRPDSYKDKTFDFKLKSKHSKLYQQRVREAKQGVITEERLLEIQEKIKANPQEYAELQPPAFIDKDVLNKAGNPKNLALDMVVNYMMANSNYYQVMVGDIAQFHKNTRLNKADDPIAYYNDIAKITMDNVVKRLAGEIAPGQSPAEVDGFMPPLKYLMLKDRVSVSTSLKFYKELKLSEEDIEKYKRIEGTDAQEFTTVEEHLDMMVLFGKITQAEKSKYLKIANKSKEELTEEERSEIQVVFQPMKPVYVNSFRNQGVLRRLYVKSSSFPLVPAMIKNTELEKLLEIMIETKTQRAAFGTAVKVGNTTKQLDIFEKDVDAEGNEFQTENIKTLDSLKKELLKTNPELNSESPLSDIFKNQIVDAPRKAIKIQQEVPYKDKQEINKVTQASKLIFVNMLNENFKTDNLPTKVKNYLTKDGKLPANIKGIDLQEAYHDLYRELFEEGRKDLENEILDNGKLNIDKLKAIIIKEAKGRNMPSNVVNSIVNDEGLKYLPYSIHSDKFESLLMSIISNRVINQKLPGRSYVLGTEEGFKSRFMTGEEGQSYLNKTEGIIYTDKYTGSINSVNRINGKMQPTQIFIQSKFKMNNGSTLDLRAKDDNGNWMWLKEDDNGTVTIDYNKIDPEVLRAFGMRIPNQGPNSTANMEIAGFLPEGSGDLIIASRDLAPQMGSDFDIDKLYTYQKSSFINNEGKLVVLNEENKNTLIKNKKDELLKYYNEKSEEEFVEYLEKLKRDEYLLETDEGELIAIAYAERDKNGKLSEETKAKIKDITDNFTKVINKKVLKNDIVDIHLAVASNPSNGIQKQMATPLDFGYLKGAASSIEGWREKRGKASTAKFTGLSDQFMKDKYISGSNGGMGTGMYSIDSVFNAILQGKEVSLSSVNPITGDLDPRYVNFAGKSISNLSSERTRSNTYTKSDMISWYQSASVDNANENLMGKLNMNSHTMAATRALNQLGFERETLLLISQDIIYDYIAEIDNLQSSINPFMGDAQAEAKRIILEKYNLKGMPNVGPGNLTVSKLEDMLKNGENSSQYNDHQYAALEFFMEMDELGTSLLKMATAVNTDTKGMGISMIEANMKVISVQELKDSTSFKNIEKVLGEPGKETINGLATTNGLMFGTELLNQIYPYNKHEVLSIFNEIEELRGTKEKSTASRVKARRDAWKAIKSYKMSTVDSNVVDNINTDRKSMMIDQKVNGKVFNESMATIIAKIKNSNHPINQNAFFQKLGYYINHNGELSTVKINASSREALDEEVIYQAFYSMLVSKSDEVITTATINGTEYEYTYATLAQDLISYQYVNGLQQGVTDFTKYIPEAYITNATNLRNIAIDGYIGAVDKENHRTDIHPMITQYFQHNPYLALDKEVETEEYDPMLKKIVKVKNVFKRGSKKINGKTVPTLFKLDRDGEYVELPVLGTKYNMEYNGDVNQYNVSVNRFQNPASLPMGSNPVKAKPQAATSKAVPNPVKQVIKEKGPYNWNAIKGKRKGTRKDVLNILEEISNDDSNENNQYLSELLLLNEHLLPENLTFTINKSGDNEYNWGSEIITLSETAVTKDGYSQEETFLHELIHSFSSTIVNDYTLGKLDKKSAEYKILSSLDRKRNSLINKVNNNKIDGLTKEGLKAVVDYKNAMDKLAQGKKVDKIPAKPSIEEFNKYYGFVNLKEFMTMSSTNKTFRNILNSTPRTDGASWIQKIVDEVMDFFGQILGLTDKNSELRAVMEDMILFVQRDVNSLNEATQADIIVINSRIDQMIKEGTIKKECN